MGLWEKGDNMSKNKNLQDNYEKIKKEIEKLPKGYISKKTINNKTKYYLQWNENGKKKSKYIKDELVEDVRKQIVKRRELQKQLMKGCNDMPKVKLNIQDNYAFKTNVIYGENLKILVSGVEKYKLRGIYKDLQEYVYGENIDKVFILYGLRRTGKTTLIRQIILNMDENDFSKTAFVQVDKNSTLADMNQDLKFLLKNGFKYVFIDEVTLIEDFVEGAALFSDVFVASGMKIVLSGTDSLGFFFSEDEQLYDRCVFLHTTFIPYKEFEEVLGIKGIDNYICYGGTMSLGGIHYNTKSTFATEKSVDEYVDSAISKNIQHSLKCYQYGNHFRALYSLYKKNELTNAINRVVEDVNHRFTIEVLTKDFISHDLGISARNLRNDRKQPNDILDNIDKKEFTQNLMKLLEIKNKEDQTIEILEEHKREIKEYLEALDLIVDIDVQTLPVENDKLYKTVVTQPGMRYSQAKNLIQSLLLDKEFQNLSLDERNEVINRILSDIKGRMMEDIVLLETKLSKVDKQVFKLQFKVGEFDMVIFDKDNSSCEIYEIKHSDKQAKEQYKHLIDNEKLEKTKFRYGKITRRVVIYRGEDFILENGIEYKNVEKYLRELF
jgi:hypothetical protein